MDNIIDFANLPNLNKKTTQPVVEPDAEPMNTWVFELKTGETIVDDGYFAVTPSFIALLDGPGSFSVVIPMDNLLSATNLGLAGETDEVTD